MERLSERGRVCKGDRLLRSFILADEWNDLRSLQHLYSTSFLICSSNLTKKSLTKNSNFRKYTKTLFSYFTIWSRCCYSTHVSKWLFVSFFLLWRCKCAFVCVWQWERKRDCVCYRERLIQRDRHTDRQTEKYRKKVWQ